jgi:hemerythrin-like metal-binding protein
MPSGHKVIQWSDSYRIGLAEIDDQHQSLIDLMNELWTAITTNAPPEYCRRILSRLELYTIEHFGAEEIMMRTIDYPDFFAHQGAHRQFVGRLQAEIRRLDAGESLTLDILHFLKDWLVNHILVNDRDYAAFFAAKNKPVGFLGRFFSRLTGGD